MARVFAAGLACTIATVLLAQQEPPPGQGSPQPPSPSRPSTPQSDPELNDESIRNALDDMRNRPAAARPIAPTTRAPAVTVPPAAGQASDPMAGMSGSDFGVPSARRLREGTFLNRREGTLLRLPTGDWVFVPRPTGTGAVDRPMVLMPSSTLQRLEESAASAGGRAPAVLSGQVFVYRGREYLLPATPSSILPGESSPEPAPANAEPQTQTGIQELIRDLEARRAPSRALTPSAGPDSDRPGATPGGPGPGAPPPPSSARTGPSLADGTLITSRRGRLVRLGGGELAFAPDSDADSAADGPIVLLPCQNLTRMEDVTLWRGDGLVLQVSGRVLNYQGRSYLLPTMFFVPAPSEVTPLQ